MANVDIVIRTISQGERDTQALKASFTEINQALEVMRKGLEAAKKAYDFAKEGATLDYQAQKFDRLAESIGTTSDALLGELKTATRGMYSDFELMANATDLVGLGLANTQEEAVRLAKVAAGLNMNMSQLVLTLTNQTTMRFDALGVSVAGFDDKLKELEATGMDTNDAFKEAFLQQAEKQLEKVGEAADTQLGTFMRLETEVKNYTTSLKQMVSDAIEPMIKKQLDFHSAQLDSLEAYTAMTGEVITSRAQYNMHRDEIEGAVEAYAKWNAQITATTDSFDRAVLNYKTGGAEIVATTDEMMKAQSDYYEGRLSLAGSVADENQRYSDKLKDISEKMADNRKEAEKLYPWEIDKVQTLDEKYADLQQQYADEQAAHEERTNKILFDLELQKLSVDGLTDAEYETAIQAGVMLGVFDQGALTTAKNMDAVTQAVADGLIEVNNMKDVLDLMSRGYSIQVALEVQGMQQLQNVIGSEAAIGHKLGIQGYASGTDGWLTVPSGYPNDSYRVGLTSGEQFAVVPNGGGRSGGGGTAMIDDASLEKLGRVIVSAVQRGM